MKKKYDPELIKEDLKKLIQQTLREALEPNLKSSSATQSTREERKTTTVTVTPPKPLKQQLER